MTGSTIELVCSVLAAESFRVDMDAENPANSNIDQKSGSWMHSFPILMNGSLALSSLCKTYDNVRLELNHVELSRSYYS